ncbi:MAG: oxygen-dependent coproporphyrinogen oxidase, partial [Myxococcota bacterium]|nr:oxygen-dependent coproporphyrinogen oxidase [Myxococcota bacterium]
EALDGSARFVETIWQREEGGGGRTRILEGGAVFEKAGVNVSAVYGKVPEALAGSMSGEGDQFYATGVSLVLHPCNPHVPTTHANFRYIERGDTAWFGGGADLTPYVLYDEDATHFHDVLAGTCDRYDPAFYPRFKAWCDTYFYLPHRGEGRGVGGLFFDDVRPTASMDMEALFGWWSDLGRAFLPAYVPIVERRMDTTYDEALRRWQLQRRGRYVEFNLLYDRGTVFGLKTGGRVESILMSLPGLVRWDHAVVPEPGSEGARLLDALRTPREWRTPPE